MKKTGRVLTLSNDINSNEPPNSIFSSNYRLTTIFEDDREGYAWKITAIDALPVLQNRVAAFSVYTVRPDAFASAVEFGVWSVNRRFDDNSLIGSFQLNINPNSSLRVNHIAVNHLALLYEEEEEDLPRYNITLEEYEITDREEIMFMIKESSQNLDGIE